MILAPKIAIKNPDCWPEIGRVNGPPWEFRAFRLRWLGGRLGAFEITWAVSRVGFGGLVFWKEGSDWACDDEMMSRVFVVPCLHAWLQKGPKQRKRKNRRWNKRIPDIATLVREIITSIDSVRLTSDRYHKCREGSQSSTTEADPA